MNLGEILTALGTSAMTLIAEVGTLSDDDLRRSGAEAQPLSTLRKLYELYYGSTAFTRKQRNARDSATRGNLGLQRLKSIENYANRLTDSTRKWPLREELTAFEGNDYDFQRHAAERVRAYNATADAADQEEPKQSKRSMKVTHHEGTTEASLTVRGPSSEIRAAEQLARERAEEEGTSPAEALLAGMCSSTSEGGVRTVVKVLVPLSDVQALRNGEGADAVLHCTNGALITGRELLEREIEPIAEYVGLTNMDGAVTISTGLHPFFDDGHIVDRAGLEREEERRSSRGDPPVPAATKAKALARFASYKDRCLLEAEQTVCAAEGCSVPVTRTQVNHNIPHSKGGLTVVRNLSMLCDYHNGKAGDREMYRKIAGVTYRVLPGGKLVRNRHPLAV
ncbi:HNH endonuclease signature motif containing protein [Corynebacterium pilosum]|uniref:Endonuclease n=1 Tax=Corynebacterium pilosum TaxID=35756 RepID=A0A376CKJ3_9CORY|nr:HNH endonuclease signature motif containing protein [Corynebacterium pilosum]STC68954.1 Endonuclease [Corynebacterium pilosum]